MELIDGKEFHASISYICNFAGITRLKIVSEKLECYFRKLSYWRYFKENFMELCYTSVDFGGDVQEMVKSMGDKIYIKSQKTLNFYQ